MDDLISRQAAIDYFVTNVGFHDEDGYPIEDTDELRKIWTEYFSGIPSAEPKRIRGRWKYNAKIGTFKVWTCDQCGWNSEAEFNFCPNCGAKMEVTE